MTLLRDISVVWATLNILASFLIFFEYRLSVKKTALLMLCFMVPVTAFQVWYLLRVGPAKMAQNIFLTMALPCVAFYFPLAKYRDGRFLYSFFLACDVNAAITVVTYLLDYYLPGDRYVVMLVSRLIAFPLMEWAVYGYTFSSGRFCQAVTSGMIFSLIFRFCRIALLQQAVQHLEAVAQIVPRYGDPLLTPCRLLHARTERFCLHPQKLLTVARLVQLLLAKQRKEDASVDTRDQHDRQEQQRNVLGALRDHARIGKLSDEQQVKHRRRRRKGKPALFDAALHRKIRPAQPLVRIHGRHPLQGERESPLYHEGRVRGSGYHDGWAKRHPRRLDRGA